MTVKELTARLEQMPQDKEIEIEIDNAHGACLEYYQPCIDYDKTPDKCIIWGGKYVRSMY